MPQHPFNTLEHARQLAQTGNLFGAEKLCELLLDQSIVEPEARHLLGVIRNIQGRYAEAETLLRQAVAEQPDIAKYHSNLGNALRGLERFDEAEACYRRAIEIDPTFEDARANLAKLFQVVESPEEAITEYRHLIRDNPKDAVTHATLAFLLQSTNRLSEAEEVATAGLKLDPADPTMNLAMATCERRLGRLEQALERLSSIDPSGLIIRNAAILHYERGLIYDRLDHIAQAFAEFTEGNRLQALGIQHSDVDKDRYTTKLDRLAQLDVGWLRQASPIPSKITAPVFLVGFPRSGTTLLDQILDSHPDIQTLEEKPIINRLWGDMDSMVNGNHENLKNLTSDQLIKLQQNYFNYVADFMELRPGNQLVDKFPLNITSLPYLLRVFPDARFILALRHPCDCVLSCYMHLFGPNDAMANFYTLKDTAALYAKVMGLWRHWANILPLRYHRVYYENLVQDLPGEIKPLLNFLGLDWHEEMSRPHEHAARRGRINTPSASQVIQPLYQRASGRWRRYQAYLNDIMPTLQPYIEYFGYDMNSKDT